MRATPDWLHGGEADSTPQDPIGISLLAVIAWIAGIAAIAEVLFVVHQFLS